MHDTFWGKTEVFWVGVQAVAAMLAFVVLYFYTVYTRRMMKLAEETKRVAITPVFSLRDWRFMPVIEPATMQPSHYYVAITIRNIGQGPAVGLNAWYQPVSDSFPLTESLALKRTPFSREIELPKRELLPSETCLMKFEIEDITRRWVLVFTSTDTAKGTHQLQLLIFSSGNEIQAMMVHGLGESFGERAVATAERFAQIIREIRKALWKTTD